MEARDIPLLIVFFIAVGVTGFVTLPIMRGAFKLLLVLLGLWA